MAEYPKVITESYMQALDVPVGEQPVFSEGYHVALQVLGQPFPTGIDMSVMRTARDMIARSTEDSTYLGTRLGGLTDEAPGFIASVHKHVSEAGLKRSRGQFSALAAFYKGALLAYEGVEAAVREGENRSRQSAA